MQWRVAKESQKKLWCGCPEEAWGWVGMKGCSRIHSQPGAMRREQNFAATARRSLKEKREGRGSGSLIDSQVNRSRGGGTTEGRKRRHKNEVGTNSSLGFW